VSAVRSEEHAMSAIGEAQRTKREEIRCESCGYGAVVERKPTRCPMCGNGAGSSIPHSHERPLGRTRHAEAEHPRMDSLAALPDRNPCEQRARISAHRGSRLGPTSRRPGTGGIAAFLRSCTPADARR
jgi:hypothetical protein